MPASMPAPCIVQDSFVRSTRRWRYDCLRGYVAVGFAVVVLWYVVSCMEGQNRVLKGTTDPECAAFAMLYGGDREEEKENSEMNVRHFRSYDPDSQACESSDCRSRKVNFCATSLDEEGNP